MGVGGQAGGRRNSPGTPRVLKGPRRDVKHRPSFISIFPVSRGWRTCARARDKSKRNGASLVQMRYKDFRGRPYHFQLRMWRDDLVGYRASIFRDFCTSRPLAPSYLLNAPRVSYLFEFRRLGRHRPDHVSRSRYPALRVSHRGHRDSQWPTKCADNGSLCSRG